MENEKPQIAVVMGSPSDYPVMREAVEVLKQFSVPCEELILSAHRTPERLRNYAQSAEGRGIRAIIAGAGGAAHLPGLLAAETPLPVFGVPIKSATLGGLDALLSIVQMPRGVPVATLSIGGAANAALFTVAVLAGSDEELRNRLTAFRKEQTRSVPLRPFDDDRSSSKNNGKFNSKSNGKSGGQINSRFNSKISSKISSKNNDKSNSKSGYHNLKNRNNGPAAHNTTQDTTQDTTHKVAPKVTHKVAFGTKKKRGSDASSKGAAKGTQLPAHA